MAINFLNAVDLNKNSLDNARIQNLASDPSAANSSIGQIYFNTTVDTLKQYVADSRNPIPDPVGTPVPGWIEVGSDSGVETFTNTNTGSTYIDFSVENTNAIGNVSIGFADLNAANGTSVAGTRFLSKDNTWDVISEDIVIRKATASALGTVELFSNTVQTVAATAVSTTASRTYGIQFNSADQMVVNVPWTDTNVVTYTLPVTAGAVAPATPTTGIITLTGSDGGNSVVTFKGTTGKINVLGDPTGSDIIINLTDSISVVDNIDLGGVITQTGGTSTTGVNDGALSASTALVLTAANTAVVLGMEVTGTGIPTNITVVAIVDTKNFTLSSAITIADGITISFEEVNSFSSPLDMNNNRISEVKTGVLGTDGVNLAQVELLVAGVGVFKGGYDATSDPGSPVISSNNNIALDQGDYFVVSAGGDITFSDTVVSVEVGDFIFANASIAAGGGVGTGPASTDYTIVLADANLATAGTVSGATAAQRGVAGFDVDYFTVTEGTDAGFVSLVPTKNPYGATQTLDNGGSVTPNATSPVVRVYNAATGLTTFTINLAQVSATGLFPTLFGPGALAKNVTAQVTQDAAPFQTVYADVTRSGSASMDIIFTGDVAVDLYRVLLTHI